jgi:outer membrane protein OmpA-like peptidoglycan-associated protein
MSDSDDELPSQSYWPSVSDLFLTLFIISIAIIAAVFCALLPTNNVGRDRALIHAVGNDLRHVREPMNRLRNVLELDPIGSAVRPSAIIVALTETCSAAIIRIESLEERLARLMGSKDAQEEMERLFNENEELKRQLAELKEQLARLTRTFGADPDAIAKIIRENEDLRRQLHDKPPNIQISEQKEDYRFESGSSVMGPSFIEGLRQNEFARLADEIIDREEANRVKVDTLEIIGHTDGVPLSRGGNLDQKLPDLLAGSRDRISSLTPGSNNDLGLLRALAVREQWAQFINAHDKRDILRRIQIRCYSAGQTILPYTEDEPEADDFRQPDPRARRIEMRLTRLLDQAELPLTEPDR